MYSEMRRPTPNDFHKVLSDPLNEVNRKLFPLSIIHTLCDDAYTVVILVKDEPVLIGGLSIYWQGRGKLWTLFTTKSKRNFVPVFRLMKKYVDGLDIKRVELDIPYGDDNLKRRAELLGFTKYADRARCFDSFGEDCTLFERIN